ncbi:MAG: hypothetical protein KGM42_14400 [Hyphomicrobiales bacterium]|nr:hypothetical protein [Hyphomicrobiales bacterium]
MHALNALWNDRMAQRHASGAWDALAAGYGERHRAYHDWSHIAGLVAELGRRCGLARRPDLVLAAVFWHDVVYETRTAGGAPRADRDNVRASADLFRRYARMPRQDADDVEELVMATADHVTARASRTELQGDMDLFLDLDLAPLAAPWPQFVENGVAIRKEFSWVPERDFLIGHTAVLKQFRDADRLYRRPETAAAWESHARANLARRIVELERRLAVL